MGVRQLGVQVEVEVGVESELLVSHLDVTVTSLLNDSTSVNGLKDGINAVVQVLNQNGQSLFYGCFDHFDDLRVGESSDLEVVLLLALSQPGDTL